MANRNGNKGQPDGPPALAVKPQRHGEEPAHRRIETVKGAEAGK
ncbi:hypothetical protein [Ensifer canadensis]